MVKTKKILSIFLVVVMLFTSLPINTFAEEMTSAVAGESATNEEVSAITEEESTQEETTERTVNHSDENIDGVCDNCGLSLDKNVIDSGMAGDTVCWTLDDEGTLFVCGSGNLYDYALAKDTPWYSHKDEIRCLVIGQGVERLHGVSFKNYQSLESVEMSDTVLSIPSSFENCVALKEIRFSTSFKVISSHCFSGCTSLESIVIPENVTEIGNSAFRNCTMLADIHFESGYIKMGSDPFYGTAAYNNPENIKDGILYIDNCLIKEITAGTTTLVLGPEITSIASGWKSYPNSKVTEVIVYNPDCTFPQDTSAVPYSAILKGLVGSTAQDYAKKFGAKFVPICICEDTQRISESYGYCDGTIGYTEGLWCERCQIWVSGHEENGEFRHIDADTDGVCDYCQESVEYDIIDAGKCGDHISWRLMSDFSLFLEGTGDMYSYTKAPEIWDEYAESITSVVVSDGITSIGDYAFYHCKNISSLVLSTVLMKIGAYAFYGCESLVEISIPETVYSVSEKAFYGCKSLESIVLPEAATILANGIFTDCSALVSAEIKGNVTSIADSMFAGCENLVTFKSANNIRTVGEKSFYNCKKLSSFVGINIHTMGKNAFTLCESLEQIKLNCLNTIPVSAFRGCKNLSAVTFSSSLKTVDTSAFMHCLSLESVVLPQSVTVVKAGAFGGCENLKEITFLNDNVSISSSNVVSDNVSYKALPSTVTIKATPASKADIYADVNEIRFVPLTEKEIASVVLTKEPDQLVYCVGKDTAFSKNGAVVTVTYTDGTNIALKKRFTVNWKDADVSTKGTYTPCIVYGNYEFPFEISVVEDYIYKGVPESRVFGEVFCAKNEVTTVCFIPTETKEYVFAFDKGTELEITADAQIIERGGVKFTEEYTYEQGKEYYFYMKSTTASKSVRISEIDDIYFAPCADGTYEAKLSLMSGNIVIPAEYGKVAVTKVADNFISNSSTCFYHVEDVTVSPGIKEIGADAFYGHSHDVILPDTITKIGKNAFKNFKGNVSLPASVEHIEEGAFYHSAIGNVTLSEAVITLGKEAFYECDGMETLTILSDNITYGKNAFAHCSNLKKVKLNNNVKSFDEYMFSGCESLEEITGTKGIEKIASGAFYGCSALLRADFIAQTTDIGGYAFYGCKALAEITFHESMTDIRPWSFYGCESLQKIELPDSVTVVGQYAFGNSKSVTEIDFSDNLRTIEQSAFSGLSVETLRLPDSIETMGDGCFQSCNKLKQVSLPEKINSVPHSAFSNCSSLEKVYSMGNISSVGDYAFYLCTNLRDVDFWDTVERVEMYAFSECDSLKNVPFEKVTYIGRCAFKNCDALESVNLPMENTYIGEEAFWRCTALKEVDIKANSIVLDEAFYECSSLEKATFADNVILGKDILIYCNTLKELYLLTYSNGKYDLGVLPENVVIYGYEGSLAQQFADEKGYEFRVVEGHAHSFTVTKVEPEKCLEYTKNVYTCACGYTYSENIHYTGTYHYYKDFTVEKDPTCTEYGLKSKHCYCGKNRKDITLIDPLGHTEVIDIPAVAPTSTAPGYTHQSHCSVCGETVVKRELIDHGEYEIQIDSDIVIAHKFDAATSENDGADVTITFGLKNNVYMSNIDKTVIYKVGEVKLSKTKFTYNGKVQKPGVSVKDSRDEPLVLNRDYKLTYSANSKYCGEYSVRVDYIGNYAGGKTLYYEIVIDAIVPVVSSSTTESITLSWEKGHSDLVYRVYSVDSNGNLNIIDDTKNSSYTVSSLKSGTEYRFLVRAYVKDGNGKVYWGDKGNVLLCSTNSPKASNSIINLIKNLIAKIKYFLQKIF
ncbi:MAG: leucine-rich repeat protein [Acutalibacteraceae bacterium]